MLQRVWMGWMDGWSPGGAKYRAAYAADNDDDDDIIH